MTEKLATKVERIARRLMTGIDADSAEDGAALLDLVADIEDAEDDADFLSCLRAADVDNWEGYALAQEEMSE